MRKKTIYPELQEGLRVQFKDRNEATRQGRIIARQGNKVTVEAALKVRMRVPAENISGYWAPKVKASPKGWWKLVLTSDTEEEIELNDGDKQHIAQQINEGYTEGEIIQE